MMLPIHPMPRRWLGLVCLVLTAGWAFHSLKIAPLRKQESAARRIAFPLREKIAEARGVIQESETIREQISRARAEVAALHAHQPSGSAHVWFPAQMKKHFSTLGTDAITRLNTTTKEPGLPDFERSFWAVEMPLGKTSADVRTACLAIAEIEPLDPAVRVLDAAIRPDADDPDRRVAVINVSVLSKKAGAPR